MPEVTRCPTTVNPANNMSTNMLFILSFLSFLFLFLLSFSYSHQLTLFFQGLHMSKYGPQRFAEGPKEWGASPSHILLHLPWEVPSFFPLSSGAMEEN